MHIIGSTWCSKFVQLIVGYARRRSISDFAACQVHLKTGNEIHWFQKYRHFITSQLTNRMNFVQCSISLIQKIHSQSKSQSKVWQKFKYQSALAKLDTALARLSSGFARHAHLDSMQLKRWNVQFLPLSLHRHLKFINRFISQMSL